MTSTAKDYWLYSTLRTAFKDTIKAGGKKTFTVQATGAYAPSIDALETSGNNNIEDVEINLPLDGKTAGTWTDASGNGYNGTVTNATLTTDRFGRTDKAYLMDAVGEKITTTYATSVEDNKYYYIGVYLNTIGTTDTTSQPLFTGASRTFQRGTIGVSHIVNGGTPDYISPMSIETWYDLYAGYINNTTDITLELEYDGVEDIRTDIVPSSTYNSTFGLGSIIFDGLPDLVVDYCVVTSRKLTDAEKSAIQEFRKYAPNLSVSELSPVEGQTNIYEFTVQNTGETDYTDVQIPLDVTSLGLTSINDSLEILNVTPIVIDFDTSDLYVNYDETVTLNATVTSEHPISKIEVYKNGVKIGEMTQV